MFLRMDIIKIHHPQLMKEQKDNDKVSLPEVVHIEEQQHQNDENVVVKCQNCTTNNKRLENAFRKPPANMTAVDYQQQQTNNRSQQRSHHHHHQRCSSPNHHQQHHKNGQTPGIKQQQHGSSNRHYPKRRSKDHHHHHHRSSINGRRNCIATTDNRCCPSGPRCKEQPMMVINGEQNVSKQSHCGDDGLMIQQDVEANLVVSAECTAAPANIRNNNLSLNAKPPHTRFALMLSHNNSSSVVEHQKKKKRKLETPSKSSSSSHKNRNYRNNNNNQIKLANNHHQQQHRDDAHTSARPTPTKRKNGRRGGRRRKRPYNNNNNNRDDKEEEQISDRKRMRWTECDAGEVTRLHRNCVQNGQPLAPYNTTQFIMNEHSKEIDFEALSGQIQQMRQNKQHNDSRSSDLDDYYYSSPEDESYFLEQQFHEAYDTMHAERLNAMSKTDLVKEYLIIEKELETLKHSRPAAQPQPAGGVDLNGGGGDAVDDGADGHRHSCCTANEKVYEENRNLRKLLRQVYNRYNSLTYCINYVNSHHHDHHHHQSGDSTNTGTTIEESANIPPVVMEQPVEEFQLANELHYTIEKYISNISASEEDDSTPMSTSSGYSVTSSSSTSSSSSSSTSTSTSTSSSSSSSGSGSTTSSSSSIDGDRQDSAIFMVVQDLIERLVLTVEKNQEKECA